MGTTKGATAIGEPTADAQLETAGANGQQPPGGGLTLLTRDEILATDDIKSEVVAVEEWGGSVMVRGLTGVQRDAFEESMVEMRGRTRTMNLRNFRANLVARSIVDGKGKRVFSNDDIERLGQKSAAALTRVVLVAQRLSGLDAAAVDELTSELKDDPSASSGTD